MELDFTLPSPEPTTLAESQALINRLWSNSQSLISELSAFKEKLNANSSNSSLPPSSDSIKEKASQRKEHDEWRKRTPIYWQKRRQGAQPGHKGVGRFLLPLEDVDEVIACYPASRCDSCDGSVTIGKVRQRTQLFDLPTGMLHVTEYQIYGGRCQSCKGRCRGEVPEGVPRGILGAFALAKISILTGKYRLSKREVQDFLLEFFGLTLSVGTVSNAERLVSESIKEVVEDVGEEVSEQSYLHADETSHLHKGQLEWLWVATNKELTYYKIYQRRNQDSAKALIGENFQGMVITDRYGAYNWLARAQRQYCWAHLKRDFKKVADRAEPKEASIGYALQDELRTIFSCWRRVRDGTEISRNRAKMRNTISQLYRTLRRGRQLKGTKTGAFCAKLIRERMSLWHFLDHDDVSPTNNDAERSLRHAVIWRKKCYATQSKRGIHFVERILTVLMTCTQQNHNLIDFVSNCVKAAFNNTSAPSLLAH